jgi:ankyrin repeat protein
LSADVNAVDKSGQTVLHKAYSSSYTFQLQLVDLLLGHGADAGCFSVVVAGHESEVVGYQYTLL